MRGVFYHFWRGGRGGRGRGRGRSGNPYKKPPDDYYYASPWTYAKMMNSAATVEGMNAADSAGSDGSEARQLAEFENGSESDASSVASNDVGDENATADNEAAAGSAENAPMAAMCVTKNASVTVANEAPFDVSITLGSRDTTDGSDSSQQNKQVECSSSAQQVFDKSSTPWVSLFKDERKFMEDLQLPTFDMQDEISLESEDLMDVQQIWGYVLIGYIAGKFPGLKAVNAFCESWGVGFQLLPHESGWLVFKFNNVDDMNKVLHGAWNVYGRPLILNVMPKNFGFGKEEVSKVPTWVKLPSLPFSCWNATALGKIASGIGKPIYMDRLTQTRERVSYARVLVEVDATKDLKEEVKITFPGGKVIIQRVVYESKPKFCSICKRIGHLTSNCSAHLMELSPSKKAATPQNKGANSNDGGAVASATSKATNQIVATAIADAATATKAAAVTSLEAATAATSTAANQTAAQKSQHDVTATA